MSTKDKMKQFLKITGLAIAVGCFCTGCYVEDRTPGTTIVKPPDNNTTIIKPPDNHTTIVNPPAQNKTDIHVSPPTSGGTGSTTTTTTGG